jgi:uncharacterized protein GlcG (DUF336 family)
MWLSLKTFCGLAIATALSSTVSAQGVVTQKNVSLAMAQTIAQAALAQCESMGFKVSVAGVSGSPGKDDVCSQAGIDKVADQLR